LTALGNHIIERVLVDVNLRGEKEAYQIKDQISGFLQNNVFPELEILLDELNAGNQIIRYDQLVFDLKIENWEQRHQIKKELVQNLRQNIVESLGVKLPKTGERWRLDGTGKILDTGLQGEFVSPAQNNRKTFLFFLEHGYLPWYGKRANLDEILEANSWEKLVSENSFTVLLISLLNEKENALQRFVFQLSNVYVISFLDTCKNVFTDRAGFDDFLKTLSVKSQKLLLEYLLRVSVSPGKEISRSRFSQLLTGFLKEGVVSLSENSAELNNELHKKLKRFLMDSVVRQYFEIEDEVKDIVMFKGHHPVEHTKRGSILVKGSIVENGPTVISKGSVQADTLVKSPFEMQARFFFILS